MINERERETCSLQCVCVCVCDLMQMKRAAAKEGYKSFTKFEPQTPIHITYRLTEQFIDLHLQLKIVHFYKKVQTSSHLITVFILRTKLLHGRVCPLLKLNNIPRIEIYTCRICVLSHLLLIQNLPLKCRLFILND